MEKVYIELMEGAEAPFYAHKGDAGMDVRANEDILIPPGETRIIKTGLKIAVEPGYEIQVRPRSGCSAKTKLRVANTPGTIDSGYRDEIGVILENISKDYFWDNDTIHKIPETDEYIFGIDSKKSPNGYYLIKKGDRIAQLIFNKVETPELDIIKDITNVEGNRNGGFGSSGTK